MASTPGPDQADLTRYHLIHAAFRGGIAQLAAATGTGAPASSDQSRNKAIAKYWKGYAGEIRAHHHAEDKFLFPALVERVPAMAPKIDRTSHDHVELDAMLDETDAKMTLIAAGADPRDAGKIIAAIREHLDEHLDFEDAEILPVIQTTFTRVEYEELDQKALKDIGMGKQAAFTVPFALTYATSADYERIWDGAPLPLKVIWYLTRGSHARMVRRAFGPDGS